MAGQDKPPQRVAERAMGIAGRWLLVVGAVLMSVYVAARIHGAVMARVALREFAQAEQHGYAPDEAGRALTVAKPKVDFSLWSMKRITAYEESLTRQFGPPLAVLEIPKINLEVPVFDGTDDLTLNRGVGRIIGTARLGRGGNVGIAGHRDGFFRGLKDVVVGDRLELKTPAGAQSYQVDEIQIVRPTDVQVLEDRGVASLTLVTCYPFYFIGDAPQRYVVRAKASDETADRNANALPNAAVGKIDN